MYDPNTNITITVKPTDIQTYLDNGYKFGRKIKRKTIKGYIWIYNEKSNKKLRIPKDIFEKYKLIGYELLPREYWWNDGTYEVKSIN